MSIVTSQLSAEHVQALFDWLGPPSSEVSDPLLLYRLILEAAESEFPNIFAEKLEELFAIHDEALVDEATSGRQSDVTLRPAEGLALEALDRLGYVPPSRETGRT